MNDAELRQFCNQMIGKFKALAELQKEMQYETIDTRFTEWELKKLIFALDTLRIKAEQTEPQIFICPMQDNYEALIEDEPQTEDEQDGEEIEHYGADPAYW